MEILRVHRKGLITSGRCGAAFVVGSHPISEGCGQEVKGDVHSLLIQDEKRNLNLLCVACAKRLGLQWNVEDAY